MTKKHKKSINLSWRAMPQEREWLDKQVANANRQQKNSGLVQTTITRSDIIRSYLQKHGMPTV